MAEGEERSEAPTPKKRSEARNKGRVAKSADLSSIVVLTGLIMALRGMGTSASRIVTHYVQNAFMHLDDTRMSPALVMQHGAEAFKIIFFAIAPLVGLAMLLSILVNIAQTGVMFSTASLVPDFNRLNPLSGLKRFISPASFVNLVKALYKIGLIGYIAFVTIRSNYPQLILMTHLDIGQAVGLVCDVVLQMATRVTVTMLILAALDFFYQRYTFEKGLKMTKEEVKQEHKQSEGSPQLKARIRARQREVAKKRMMSEVPAADVVITNPTHFAVALKYDTEKGGAPVVVAKGMDLLALKMRELAQNNDVPIVENPPLARALYKQVELGHEIPGDLYEAVAEVLAFVYQINQKRRERMGFATSY